MLAPAAGTLWMLPGICQDGVQLVGLFQLVETVPYQICCAPARPAASSAIAAIKLAAICLPFIAAPIN